MATANRGDVTADGEHRDPCIAATADGRFLVGCTGFDSGRSGAVGEAIDLYYTDPQEFLAGRLSWTGPETVGDVFNDGELRAVNFVSIATSGDGAGGFVGVGFWEQGTTKLGEANGRWIYGSSCGGDPAAWLQFAGDQSGRSDGDQGQFPSAWCALGADGRVVYHLFWVSGQEAGTAQPATSAALHHRSGS